MSIAVNISYVNRTARWVLPRAAGRVPASAACVPVTSVTTATGASAAWTTPPALTGQRIQRTFTLHFKFIISRIVFNLTSFSLLIFVPVFLLFFLSQEDAAQCMADPSEPQVQCSDRGTCECGTCICTNPVSASVPALTVHLHHERVSAP